LAEDLERWSGGEPIRARPTTVWERAVKWARRQPAAAALVAVSSLAVIVVVAALGVSYWLVRDALADSNQANAELTAEKGRTQAALDSVTQTKEELRQTLDRERQATYRQGIAAAQQAWSTNNVPQAEEFLAGCPEGLRSWEWHYLQRLCHGGTLTLDLSAFPVRPPGRWLVARRRHVGGRPLVRL